MSAPEPVRVSPPSTVASTDSSADEESTVVLSSRRKRKRRTSTPATYRVLLSDSQLGSEYDQGLLVLVQQCRAIGLTLYQDTSNSEGVYFDASQFNTLGGYTVSQGIKGKFLKRIRQKMATESHDASDQEEEEDEAAAAGAHSQRDSWDSQCLSDLVSSYQMEDLERVRTRHERVVDRGVEDDDDDNKPDGAFLFLLHLAVLAAWVESKYRHAEWTQDRWLAASSSQQLTPDQVETKLMKILQIPKVSVLRWVLHTQPLIEQLHESEVREAMPVPISVAAPSPPPSSSASNVTSRFSTVGQLMRTLQEQEEHSSTIDRATVQRILEQSENMVAELRQYLQSQAGESDPPPPAAAAADSVQVHTPMCRSKKQKVSA